MIYTMQKEAFEVRWAKARQLEAMGDIPLAIEVYEGILADEPDRLYARLRASTLLQMQGAYRRARQHAIDAAEAVRHSRWNDLPYVTSKLLTFDEQQLLLALIRGTDWNHRDVIAVSPMLVQHLWLAGAVDDAVELAEIALRTAPAHVQLNYAYGIALGYVGRLDDAVATFEKCIAIDPAYAAAHWSLAYARKQAAAEIGRLSRIELAIQQEGRASEKPFLHYAAFKEHHDAGHHDAAWKHLVEGARIKRESLDYDASREAELSEWLLAQPEQDARSGMIKGPAEAVFIVGMPRTGTTVLDRILGNHPDLASGGELSDFRSALNQVLDQFIGSVPSVASLSRLKQSDLVEAGHEYLARTRWRANPAGGAVVDKHPENFFLSGLIMDAMPSARIICMRRNPMDACFSNLKELFANRSYGYSYDLIELADHYDRFDRLSRHWAAHRPNQFMLVDYEDLVGEPEMQARRIFDFLGLPYRLEYADITRNNSAVTTASASQVREPLSKRNIGAWKAYASYLAPLKERLCSLMVESRQVRDDTA